MVVYIASLAAAACGERTTNPEQAPCVPLACADVAGACGSVPDGCGAHLSCGCPGGQVCNESVCVVALTPPPPPPPPPECSRLFSTCAEIGRSCGEITNGCGEGLECGSCPTHEACGAGGQPGSCASPPIENPLPLWWTVASTDASDFAVAIARRGEREALLLWYAGAEEAFRLDRVSPQGTVPVRSFRVAGQSPVGFAIGSVWVSAISAPDGSLYVRLAGDPGSSLQVDLGGGPRVMPIAAQISGDGSLVRELCAGPECRIVPLAADARGNVVVLEHDGPLPFPTSSDRPSATMVVRADGSRMPVAGLSSAGAGSLAPDECISAAFSGDEIVCGGSVTGEVEYGYGRRAARNPSVAKLDSRGNVLWSRSVPGVEAAIQVIGTTALGTIVAGGTFSGFGRFGDDWLDYRRELPMSSPVTMLLALERDGAARWARQLGSPLRGLSVGPKGRVAAITGGEMGPSVVSVFDLSGSFRARWRASPGFDAHPTAVDAGSDDVLVALRWKGAVSFGPAPATTYDVAVVAVPF